jgi:DNA-binding phage protein
MQDNQQPHTVSSFLEKYNQTIGLTAISEITGVNRFQLWRYMSGMRTPSERTAKKIEESVRSFGEELRGLTITKG